MKRTFFVGLVAAGLAIAQQPGNTTNNRNENNTTPDKSQPGETNQRDNTTNNQRDSTNTTNQRDNANTNQRDRNDNTLGTDRTHAPDNTKTNKRDRNDSTLTADKQHRMSKSDTEMVRKIRQSVHSDKGLSTYGHNVKIMVQDGRVTLRGPVNSQMEKDQIQKKAETIAGAANVTNDLEIAPGKNNNQ